MRFLGTCAADGMPNPFCNCPICEDARKNPSHRRFRSCFLLDEKNLIDCGPDLFAICSEFDINLSNLENIFITHTHDDHFCQSNSGLMSMSVTWNQKPINVYLSEKAYENVTKICSLLGEEFGYQDGLSNLREGKVNLHPVKVGVPFTAGGYKVTAVPTTHRASMNETAINYVFEKDGKKFLYACDTGFYQPEALEILKDMKLDIMVMECTWGNRTDKDARSHMNCLAYLQQLENLEKVNAITKQTKLYATHINHKHTLTHDLLQKWFDDNSKYKVTVACDGLKVN